MTAGDIMRPVMPRKDVLVISALCLLGLGKQCMQCNELRSDAQLQIRVC